jgi:hypothetical protein
LLAERRASRDLSSFGDAFVVFFAVISAVSAALPFLHATEPCLSVAIHTMAAF